MAVAWDRAYRRPCGSRAMSFSIPLQRAVRIGKPPGQMLHEQGVALPLVFLLALRLHDIDVGGIR